MQPGTLNPGPFRSLPLELSQLYEAHREYNMMQERMIELIIDHQDERSQRALRAEQENILEETEEEFDESYEREVLISWEGFINSYAALRQAENRYHELQNPPDVATQDHVSTGNDELNPGQPSAEDIQRWIVSINQSNDK